MDLTHHAHLDRKLVHNALFWNKLEWFKRAKSGGFAHENLFVMTDIRSPPAFNMLCLMYRSTSDAYLVVGSSS
jgi:hypothetical protein